MISGLTVADLARDPYEVARALPAWRRGDADEAVMATLDLAARHLHDRTPVIWIWSGRTPDDCPAWILPIRATQAMAFGPRGPARVLMHALRAAVEAGVLADAVSVLDWHGFVLLTLPDLDDEIAPLALAEVCAHADAVVLAPLPESLRPDGEDIPLVGPPPHLDAADPLAALSRATWSHPIRVALTLAAHGQSIDAPSDPCPRRRRARTVLRRLLRMGKVGDQHHTEFDNLYRGAAADDRRDALEVGEALVRAGLLGEKPSVGQRHVYLRRDSLPDIHALIDRGETRNTVLAGEWTARGPGEA